MRPIIPFLNLIALACDSPVHSSPVHPSCPPLALCITTTELVGPVPDPPLSWF
jgi:hypothetical protein